MMVYKSSDGKHGASRFFEEEMRKKLLSMLGATEIFTVSVEGENLQGLESMAKKEVEERGLGPVINLTC